MKGRAIGGQVDVDAFAGCPWRNRKGAKRIVDYRVDMPEAETSVHGERAEELARIRPQGESAWATQPPWTDVGGVKAGTGFVGVWITQTTTQEAVRVSRYDQIFLTPMARYFGTDRQCRQDSPRGAWGGLPVQCHSS